MQTLGLDGDESGERPRRFWRRQFQAEPTLAQVKWDWACGVILPVLCIYLDPFVFEGWIEGEGALLGAFRPFVYVLSFVSVLSMAAWILWRERLGGFNALLAGLFGAASLASFAVGLVLFPFSLLGSFVLIGFLGFTPLFTSFIFLRNAVRAARAAGMVLPKRLLVHAILVSALFSGVVPYVINMEVRDILHKIETGDAATIRSEGFKLKLVAPLVDTGAVRHLHRSALSEAGQDERTRALEELYLGLTGEDAPEW